MKFTSVMILSLAFLFSPLIYSAPVNVNIEASYDIAESLEISQSLAESIAMHCEVYECTEAEDIQNLNGMTQAIFDRIRLDLRFNIMERSLDLNGDC
ncbi:hypothetical protein [Thiomicrorhabdus sp. Milos-T2]|uniref:hypothetical protein n=1 Tax=Thiomicrorhabdus sp. Milos-T2 TaxID=90814 RepID=UPI00049434F3|nr:hypothetical protein [Thiomicrorhabdus sp. Milos-T2]